MRLHRTYGSGLQSAVDAETRSQVSPNGDPSNNGVYPDGTLVVVNYPIQTKSWKALPLGLAISLQYNNQTLGKCFYAVSDTINFVDIFEADLNNLFTEGDFYQLIVYDPIRFLSNYLALYE